MNNKLYCGLDFHKNISEFCVMDQMGKIIDRGRLTNEKTLLYFSNKESHVIAIESTGGAFDFADKLKAKGHEIKIINSLKFKAIGIGGKKNDRNDAEALATALRLDFVPEVYKKSLYSRKLKSFLTMRDMVVQTRTSLICHVRGLLREYGFVLPQGREVFEKQIYNLLEELECPFMKECLSRMVSQIAELTDQQINIEKNIDEVCKDDERIKRIQTVPGIGKLSAVAFVACIEDANRFENSKAVGSYLGLIPREASSGNKQKFGSITRCGPEMVRRYLIHGARAIITMNKIQRDGVQKWTLKIKDRAGVNKATVALAHKNARIALAILKNNSEYGKFEKVA